VLAPACADIGFWGRGGGRGAGKTAFRYRWVGPVGEGARFVEGGLDGSGDGRVETPG
jgi:hypothetical protein